MTATGPIPYQVTAAGTHSAQAATSDILLWVALPYVVIAVFTLGHIWRYRYDKFGWTTGYRTRPYIVYRSRDTTLGRRPPRRGWEPLR